MVSKMDNTVYIWLATLLEISYNPLFKIGSSEVLNVKKKSVDKRK